MKIRLPVIPLSALLLAAMACGSTMEPPRTGGPGPGRGGGPSPGRTRTTPAADASAMYLRQGLMAAASPVPFVGQTAFFAGAHAESTLVLLTISFPSRGLTFVREGDRYRATYAVTADLRTTAGSRRVADATEFVRVISYSETQSGEERIIFQRYFNARPGSYRFSLIVRDQGGARASVFEKDLVIPVLADGAISSPVMVHNAELRATTASPPRLVASPRSTGTLGRDSVILAYVETYGAAPGAPIVYGIVNDRGSVLWRDSVSAIGTNRVSGAVVRIPVTAIGAGVGQLRAWSPSGRDSTQAPLFVGFGDDLPVASFTDMLGYLRFYVSPERLAAMRAVPEDQRNTAWSALLRETDPNPATQQHEGMLAYFDRIRAANERFRDESVDGWLTDRGKVFVTLGEPDQLAAGGTEITSRARSIAWDYQRFSLRIFFFDRNGLGRTWEMDPASEAEFNEVARRERVG